MFIGIIKTGKFQLDHFESVVWERILIWWLVGEIDWSGGG
jgi:hypothetical protein